MQVINDDCRNAMRAMEPDSISSIVTDPPYGLKFMGKGWDHSVPGVEFWQEALRVAKPGCHLLAFGGTRTYHRLACAIEDAGWEIRDNLMWVYGSGWPKGLDVSKAIDKELKAEREVDLHQKRKTHVRRAYHDSSAAVRCGTCGNSRNGKSCFCPLPPAVTDDAKQWQGWNTALKPAYEPIILARKPLTGTVAGNVLEHGTGSINIDACRVGTDEVLKPGNRKIGDGVKYGKCEPSTEYIQNKNGRWPANFIHDGSEEVLELFPRSKAGGNVPIETDSKPSLNCYGEYDRVPFESYKDDGSAARFFYCAKASHSERGEYNTHATVKPLALMRYLIKLITPPNGILLDPFAGSGSTLVAASQLGFDAIGIELDKVHCDIIERRLKDLQGVFAE